MENQFNVTYQSTISRFDSLAQGQSYDWTRVSEATLKIIGKMFYIIQTMGKRNKEQPECIFLGISKLIIPHIKVMWTDTSKTA